MAFYLSGRVIVYTNQVPYETDILRTNDYIMSAVGGLSSAVVGFGISEATTVSGLPCTPISPPGLSVVVGPGTMYSLEYYDSTDYGVIPADTNPNHQIYKQAFNWDPVTLATPAPSGAGNYVIYLIEGIFTTTDVNNVSRPYFNSVDPTMPIFENQYDTRYDSISFLAKAGNPAPSPTPPTPDAGYTGLYYVTVANGQTSIISGNIVPVSNVEGQPFITEGLTQKISSADVAAGYVSIPNEQNSTYTYAIDVGSVNAYAANPSPAYQSPRAGTIVRLLPANTNTGFSTFSINGYTAAGIVVNTPLGIQGLSGGEIQANVICELLASPSAWQLMNPAVEPALISQVNFNSTTQQTVSGTTAVIQFDNTVYDPNSWWDPVNYRFSPGIAGKFLLSCYFISDTAGTVTASSAFYVNGSETFQFDQVSAGSALEKNWKGSKIIRLTNTTSYIDARLNCPGTIVIGNASGNSAYTIFEISYLGN